jgi:hypothetical protein
VVCWSISIKIWWFDGVFPLNFGGMLEYSTIPPKFNGNTPTYHQSLMEILQHTTKSISIKLWWYVGVFLLKFGGLMEYFH